MKRLLLSLIRAYQRVLSPRLPRMCRFTPSCSHYGYEAIDDHGVLLGLLLTSFRIVRCNPFCRGGHDPVPKRLWGTGSGWRAAPRAAILHGMIAPSAPTSAASPKRTVSAPSSDVAPGVVLRVELAADEEVRWQWTHGPDGQSRITGYEIVKASPRE